jgi:alpha-galactosidase
MSMTGVLGIGGNVLTWSAEELREAAELVELYKDIRPVVQHGVAYRIDSGVQYVHGDRVVVVNWRVPGEYGVPAVPARLTALDPSAVYRDDAGRSHHGAVLLAHGLPWQSPPGEYASRVVRLTIEEPPRGGDGR